MFRNFVKPAALDRVSMRERNGDSEQVFAQVYETTDEKDGDIYQHAPSNGIHSTSDHSGGVRISLSNGQTKESLSSKSHHKTSIYVNGTIHKSKSSVEVPVGRNQISHQQHQQYGNTKHALPLNKSSSLPNSKPDPSFQSRSNIQNRLPNAIPEEHSNRSNNNFETSNERNQKRQNATINNAETQRSNTVSNICDKSDNSLGSTGKTAAANGSKHVVADTAANRRALYFQEKYNVVPPPPPLVESVFAGLRDIRDPASIREKQIVSVKGTVRGFKNRVRAGIATFWAQSEDKRNYRLLEQGKIVVYATSMSVVRETSDRCRSVRRLLQNHMVRYEERDLYMSREIQQELQQRLAAEGVSMIRLPHVFADGIHLGGAEELEKLNEAGELRGLLDNYQKVHVRIMCDKCGGYRFVPCEFCHGSKKSLLRNHFTEELCALRCMHCDENGLRRCDMCVDQQE